MVKSDIVFVFIFEAGDLSIKSITYLGKKQTNLEHVSIQGV